MLEEVESSKYTLPILGFKPVGSLSMVSLCPNETLSHTPVYLANATFLASSTFEVATIMLSPVNVSIVVVEAPELSSSDPLPSKGVGV